MIDRYIRRPWPPEVVTALARFKQGDLIERPPFFYGKATTGRLWGADEEAGEEDPTDKTDGSQVDELHPEDSPPFGIITTQTCDLCEQGVPAQPWLQVSPVYQLEGSDREQEQLLSKGYAVELDGPGLPDGRWVADLRIELPVEKTALVGREPIAGFASEQAANEFGNRLGVRRARAALANELVETVVKLIRKRKANNKKRSSEVWPELYRIGLQIEEGTRMKPIAVRLHVLTLGPPSEQVRTWFDRWEDAARIEAENAGITLHTTRYHDASSMDVLLADRLVDLGIQ